MRRIGIALALMATVASACGGGNGGSSEAGASGGGDPAVLPAAGGFGGRLAEGASFSVVLLVTKDQPTSVDLVGVACAPDGTFTSSNVYTISESAPLTDGSFTAASTDVRIEGSFTTPTRAEGSIEALTQGATDCGIGENATWVAECDMSVDRVAASPAEEGDIVVGNVASTTENGTAFGMLEMVTKSGDRLQAELGDDACAAA